MDPVTRETTTRTPPRKFAVAVACLGGGAAVFTYSAFSGDQDWQRHALMAIGFWLLLALLVIHQFYWYRLAKSSRLMVVGVFGVGMGVALVVATALLHLPNVMRAVPVILAGAVLIGVGLWNRSKDRDAVEPTVSDGKDSLRDGDD